MKRLLTALVCLVPIAASAVGQNLRDRARQEGGRAVTQMSVEYPVMQIPDLTTTSDLILRGRVVSATPHLRDDGSAVVTDYLIAPMQTIKQRVSQAVARPGESTAIVVRRSGGICKEGDYTFATGVNVYPEAETFQVGDDVILFLLYDRNARVYYFNGGPFGAFRVNKDQVNPMTSSVAERRGDAPTAVLAFMNNLVAAAR